jgi:cytochrome c oxidase subunit 7c
MLSRTAMRMPTVANQIVARRGFSSTRTQLASPYHYPEGPRSNLPFNPLTKFFALRFWGFMGELPSYKSRAKSLVLTCSKPPVSSFPSVSLVNLSPQLFPPQSEYLQYNSLAAQEEPIDVSRRMHLHWSGFSATTKTLARPFRMYIIVTLNFTHVYDFVSAFQSLYRAQIE